MRLNVSFCLQWVFSTTRRTNLTAESLKLPVGTSLFLASSIKIGWGIGRRLAGEMLSTITPSSFFPRRKPRSSAPPSNLNGYKRGQSISFFFHPWVRKDSPFRENPIGNHRPARHVSNRSPFAETSYPCLAIPDRSG